MRGMNPTNPPKTHPSGAAVADVGGRSDAPPAGDGAGFELGAPKPRRGRPPGTGKLDEAMIERICTAIAAGNYLKTAAALAGVSPGTASAWITMGKRDDSPEIYRLFASEVQKARAIAEARAVQHIMRAAGEGQWTGSAWYLERTNPDEWGKKERVEVTGADGAPLMGGSADDSRILALAAAVAQRAREQQAVEAGPGPVEGRLAGE